VKFAVSADSYDVFMGRYSKPLATVFSDFADIGPGMTVLDVGSGPGALTAELVRRVGDGSVSAAEPSQQFVAAMRERYPQVDIRMAAAEELPFGDHAFDASLAQLVVHFMVDPAAGIGEMRRVTRPGGIVAACVWDHNTGGGPLSLFWEAARALDPNVVGEDRLPGSREGDLATLFESAHLNEVIETSISVQVEHPTFDDWWQPFTFGVGPAGSYVAGLAPERRQALRELCGRLQSEAPFLVTGKAWAARGIV
jgi:SAM-dependent methyltransferase